MFNIFFVVLCYHWMSILSSLYGFEVLLLYIFLGILCVCSNTICNYLEMILLLGSSVLPTSLLLCNWKFVDFWETQWHFLCVPSNLNKISSNAGNRARWVFIIKPILKMIQVVKNVNKKIQEKPKKNTHTHI